MPIPMGRLSALCVASRCAEGITTTSFRHTSGPTHV
jgi:hypothetical protein